MEIGNCTLLVANPKKNPIRMNNSKERFKPPKSSGILELINTSKNKNIAIINRGNLQIFIFFIILKIEEGVVWEICKAILILVNRPINRKNSGTINGKNNRSRKSMMGAIIIGKILYKTTFKFLSEFVFLDVIGLNSVIYPITNIPKNGIISAMIIL